MGGRNELAKDDNGLSSPMSTGDPGPSPPPAAPTLIKGLDEFIKGQRELWIGGGGGHKGGKNVVGATGEGKKIVST